MITWQPICVNAPIEMLTTARMEATIAGRRLVVGFRGVAGLARFSTVVNAGTFLSGVNEPTVTRATLPKLIFMVVAVGVSVRSTSVHFPPILMMSKPVRLALPAGVALYA